MLPGDQREAQLSPEPQESSPQYFFALSNSFRQLPPVLCPAPHFCCAPDHQGIGLTKQGTEMQPQGRWQIGKPTSDLSVGAISVIEGAKPSTLPAHAHCPLHHTGDRGVPAAAASHKGFVVEEKQRPKYTHRLP